MKYFQQQCYPPPQEKKSETWANDHKSLLLIQMGKTFANKELTLSWSNTMIKLRLKIMPCTFDCSSLDDQWTGHSNSAKVSQNFDSLVCSCSLEEPSLESHLLIVADLNKMMYYDDSIAKQ